MKEKNIRKDYVESIDELKEGIMLGIVGIHYYNLFKKATQKINNDEVVVKFWNDLIDQTKYSKLNNITTGALSIISGTALGTIMAKIGGSYSDLVTAALLIAEGTFALPMLVVDKANHYEAKGCELELEGLRVLYPDLYDIELIFNQVPYSKISEGYKANFTTDRYEGKQIYLKAHKEYEKYKAENPDKKISDLLKPEEFVKNIKVEENTL